MAILEVRRLRKNFGGLSAVRDFDLDVDEFEIHGIIGPNGAGKTTLFNLISGFLSATGGSVVFRGEELVRLPVHYRVEKGVVRSFQLISLFPELTVYENAYIGYHRNYRTSLLGQFLHTASARRERDLCSETTEDLLEFMGLIPLKDELAKNLPYGQQKSLGICIALATKPSLLMLDEPVAGMNPEETMNMVKLVRKIRDSGVTILLVEHDMAAVGNLCERISVLNYGEKIAAGSMSEIKENERVVEAYLGKWDERELIVLLVKDLRFHYGKAEVIKGVSIRADLGEIVSLVGANGAGKTTILCAISGLKKATSCEIWFKGKRIDGMPAYKVANEGIAHCPEGGRIFHSMKVVDNLLLGAFLRKDKREIAQDFENVYERFPVLRKRSEQLACSLSGGERQMLAIGRALMSKPKLLLLDEPSLGLSPILVFEIAKIIKKISQTGVTIVLVEQNARMAFGLSNRAYVLELGKIILEGKSSDLSKDERIRKAYFGGN